MNKKQKKIKLKKQQFKSKPLNKLYPTAILIKDWKDLIGLESENYYIDIKDYNGWIRSKNPENEKSWLPSLSTHTFYGMNYKNSTHELQKYGFNVIIDSWDR